MLAHISRVLKRFTYSKASKAHRGVLLRYLQRTSDYRRAQVTRLVARWQQNRLAKGPLMKRHRPLSIPFKRKFLTQDIDLLFEVDKAKDHVCGPATACLLNRAFTV